MSHTNIVFVIGAVIDILIALVASVFWLRQEQKALAKFQDEQKEGK
jgi:phage-related minor tail protein